MADTDEITYLGIARSPYYGESSLRDPFSGKWENVPYLHAWMLFAPLAKMARLLGLPLILTSILWRIVGGAILGGVLFFLFRRLFTNTQHPIAWALGCSLICLADAGFASGRTMVGNVSLVSHIWHGTTPYLKADALPQYRVVTPILNLPFLLLVVASLLTNNLRKWKNILLGAGALGICCLLYFYFWTAAVLALGLYGIWLLAEAWKNDFSGKGRTEWLKAQVVGLVVLGGLMIGAPQIISNSQAFANTNYKPILERIGRPCTLPPDSPARQRYLSNLWVLGKLAIGAVGILAFGLVGLRLLWCFTLAGYALANSAFVTGLEFENFHWSYVHASMGEILVLATLVQLFELWPRMRNKRWLQVPAWGLTSVLVLTALIWRAYETTHAPEAVRHRRVMQDLTPLKPSLMTISDEHTLVLPAEAGVAVLFSQGAQLYQQYTWNSFITDNVLHERHALNGWLLGLDLETYRQSAAADVITYCQNPERQAASVTEMRVSIFNQLLAQPNTRLLEQYRPNYLLLPTTAPEPQRGGPWRLIQKSPTWSFWAKTAD
ncbi:MAG: hypothetical protein ABI977_22875 [Acidobacteriota bacterium]